MAGEDEGMPLMRGFIANRLVMIDEVVRGTSWEVAWSMRPLGDPCALAGTQLGTLSLLEYCIALRYIDSPDRLRARREGGSTNNSNSSGGGWRKNAKGQ